MGVHAWQPVLGRGRATAAFGKWHVGDIAGRLPTDRGFDEWFGIKNTSDESGYTSYPLFVESGQPVPRIWQGVKGAPVTPVDDFTLQTRPLLDEQIAARASAFILTSVDWLPTLASLVGERERVPTDRPIDGLDASGFLLGRSLVARPVGWVGRLAPGEEMLRRSRSFAARNRYDIDIDREFVALGACNLAASVSQGFAVTGADSRTAVNISRYRHQPFVSAATVC